MRIDMQGQGRERVGTADEQPEDDFVGSDGAPRVTTPMLRVPQRPPWLQPSRSQPIDDGTEAPGVEDVAAVPPAYSVTEKSPKTSAVTVSELREQPETQLTVQGAQAVIAEIADMVEHVTSDVAAESHAVRNARMIHQYSQGASLDEVGQEYGLTRERVRQIINKSPWPTGRIIDARKILREWEAEQETRRISESVSDWSMENPGVSIEQAVRDLELSRSVISRALGERRTLHSTSRKRAGGRRVWEDHELIALLRQFHQETGLTSADGFEQWSRARGGPTKQTPSNRFGKWSGALAAAGIEGSYSVERERAHSDDDLWAAIVEFFTEPREGYTYRHLEEWLAAVPGRPSGALLRIRLSGTWLDMSRTGQRLAAGFVDKHDPNWVADVRKRRDWSTFVREDINYEDHLRRALAEIGPVLTIAAYSQWAKENNAPNGNVLVRNSELSWNELVRSVGGRPGQRGKYMNMSDDELISPLVDYCRTHNVVTFTGYEEWSREHDKPRPTTLVKRFGSWEETVQRARQHADTAVSSPRTSNKITRRI